MITPIVTGRGAEVGHNTSLRCNVSGTNNLVEPTLTYEWLRGNMTIPMAVRATLMLGPLRTNDSGSYRCRVTVNDVFLSDSITRTSEKVNINIQGKS